MTVPVKGASGAQGTSAGGSYSCGVFSEHQKKDAIPRKTI